MDYAATIKELLPTPEVFSFYGFHRNRGGFICCPFHNEKTPSMKVYDGSRGFHCFGGCGAHGDVVDFVQRLFGLSSKDAQSKLNDDFHLGLPINSQVDDNQRRQLRREADERRRHRDAVRKERDRLYKAYDDALAEWIRLDRQRTEYAPTGPSEALDDRYVEAVQKIDYAAHVLDSAEAALIQFEQLQK